MKKVKTICIVDDDAVYQFAIKRSIRNFNSGIEVIAFTNAEKAIDHLKEQALSHSSLPDILLVDINMPLMDGWQFLDAFSEIKSQISKVPDIYMASSSLDDTDISRAKGHSNVSGFLLKPLNVASLFEKYEISL